MKTSCLTHPANQRLVLLKEDFLNLHDQDLSAAIVLAIFEHWTNVLINSSEQTQQHNARRRKKGLEEFETELWIYKSHDDLISDSLGLLKRHQIKAGLKKNIEKGFLKKRNNPRYSWDRTLQYKVNIQKVNLALKQTKKKGKKKSSHRSQMSNASVTGVQSISHGRPIDRSQVSDINKDKYKDKYRDNSERETHARATDELEHPRDDFDTELEPIPSLVSAIAEAASVDFDHCTDKKRMQVGQTAESLRAMNPKSSDDVLAVEVSTFGEWFRSRGLRDPAPSLSQIVNDWPKFRKWQEGDRSEQTASRKNVRQRARTEQLLDYRGE